MTEVNAGSMAHACMRARVRLRVLCGIKRGWRCKAELLFGWRRGVANEATWEHPMLKAHRLDSQIYKMAQTFMDGTRRHRFQLENWERVSCFTFQGA